MNEQMMERERAHLSWDLIIWRKPEPPLPKLLHPMCFGLLKNDDFQNKNLFIIFMI